MSPSTTAERVRALAVYDENSIAPPRAKRSRRAPIDKDAGASTDEMLLLTDVTNAERVWQRHRDELRFLIPDQRFLVYASGRWQLDDDGQVQRWVVSEARAYLHLASVEESKPRRADLIAHHKRSESDRGIRATVERLKPLAGIVVRRRELDAHPFRLNVVNGTLDLRTGTLHPHDAADLLCKQSPIAYDPNAICPLWLEFLVRVMAGCCGLIDFLQRVCGYLLTGSTDEQCLFLLHGPGANGKSVFLRALYLLLGDLAVQADFTTFLSSRFEGPRNDIARLDGSRLVIASEAGENRRFDEAMLKQMTGGDVVTARRLYSESFEYLPAFKIMLAANHKPNIRETDLGIWRRIRLIPFSVTIPESERDPQLVEKLRAELPGILNWALKGCLQWQSIGLLPPAAVVSATEEYRNQSDILGQFIEECCSIGPHHSAPLRTLYDAYASWAERSGEHPISNLKFGQSLTVREFGKDQRGHEKQIYRTGIALSATAARGSADYAE